MRKLTKVLVVAGAYVMARKLYRRALSREIWESNVELSAQCVRCYNRIERDARDGKLDKTKLHWHLENLLFYADLIVPKFCLSSTPIDRQISWVYGDYWPNWTRDRLRELDRKVEVNLSLVKGEKVA